MCIAIKYFAMLYLAIKCVSSQKASNYMPHYSYAYKTENFTFELKQANLCEKVFLYDKDFN